MRVHVPDCECDGHGKVGAIPGTSEVTCGGGQAMTKFDVIISVSRIDLQRKTDEHQSSI